MYEKFEALLKERNLTTAAVANETGISNATFSDWKRGKSQPKLDKIVKLAEFFGVPIEYFVA